MVRVEQSTRAMSLPLALGSTSATFPGDAGTGDVPARDRPSPAQHLPVPADSIRTETMYTFVTRSSVSDSLRTPIP